MKNLLFIFLFLVVSLDADVDLGEDFAAGDLVTADAFNTKFNALKSVVGEIVDADLLGNWECTSFKYGSDSGYLETDGGNGQVGDGYFYSKTGNLSFTETDTESSLNSPKNWSIDQDNVLLNHENMESGIVQNQGTYSLLGNVLYLFNDLGSLGGFNIKPLSGAKIFLSPTSETSAYDSHGNGDRPLSNPNVICELIASE